MKSVVTMGETLGLFRAASEGDADTFVLGMGGADSNVAIGLARLGTSVVWFGRVGNDPIGRRIVKDIREEGVDVRATVDPSGPTGIMIKTLSSTDERPVVYYREGSAGSRLSARDFDHRDIANALVLHVTGITAALSGSAHDAVLAAVRIANDADVPVSFDLNHRHALWQGRDPTPLYRRIVQGSEIVFAGEDEARILFPESLDAMSLARAVALLGPRQVIIKMGERGCVAIIDDVEYRQGAIPVRVVDTVGAGDAFAAGYLAELSADASPATRLLTAAKAGAFACTHRGDWEGLPSRQDLK